MKTTKICTQAVINLPDCIKHLKHKIWTSTNRLLKPNFQSTSLFRLAIMHLQESPESTTTRVKHNCASLRDIVKEQITKTWFINETQI